MVQAGHGQGPWTKARLYLKNKTKEKRAGGMAQAQGPEFKLNTVLPPKKFPEKAIKVGNWSTGT